ncbi:MAG: UvrD-helicase domain-containing protein [Coriobacteriales bacterium]
MSFEPTQEPLTQGDAVTASSLDLASLNPRQREAVLCTEGPLLVLAGAGSGKTRVLTYRIAHMVEDLGVAPWQILAITFTNKAAKEMRDRLERLLGDRSTRGMWVCTFHAMCVRMLRINADRLGFTNNFTIYDDDDSKRLMKDILTSMHSDAKANAINDVRARISRAKNELMDPSEMASTASTPVDELAARAYEELQRRLRRANAMDFDDLLVNAYRLLDGNTDVLEGYQDRFAYVCVDEYQDTNRAQYMICRLLARKRRNVMVVGDDDQSIYSWRGADVRNILDFNKDYPEAHLVKLEQNYRSTGHILEAANAVVANNTQRTRKRLFTEEGDGERIRLYLASDERDEGRWIASQMSKLHDQGVSYKDMALFYRTNAQSRILEDMLMRAGIPYAIVGGTRFFDRAEIRDVTAYLKLVVNPADDMSAQRVINKPARGIGATTQQHIAQIAAQRGMSFLDAAEVAIVEDGSMSSRARNSIARFLQFLRDARGWGGDLSDVVKAIVDRSGLVDALMADETPESQERIDNIREFYGVVQDYVAQHEDAGQELPSNDEVLAELGSGAGAGGAGGPAAGHAQPGVAGALDLAGFMEWLTLRTDLDSADLGGQNVTLMTIHSAKGLEFDTVFVAGMEETIFPHVRWGDDDGDAALEEERRLAYVAITRARRRLFLTYAQQRHLYGEVTQNPRSRFIDEIPEEHVETVGVGSLGFSGLGWEKRGDRHGTFGSGRGSDMYGGHVFGSRTRSSGLGAPGSSQPTFGSTTRSRPSGRAEAQAAPARPAFDAKRASAAFAAGDRVSHKVFGAGTVVSVKGDAIQVHFDSGATKKLLKGYAPIVKIG